MIFLKHKKKIHVMMRQPVLLFKKLVHFLVELLSQLAFDFWKKKKLTWIKWLEKCSYKMHVKRLTDANVPTYQRVTKSVHTTDH